MLLRGTDHYLTLTVHFFASQNTSTIEALNLFSISGKQEDG